MFYKPIKERMWDTWMVNENSKYYLYYIRVSENGTRWDGISLAISDDLVHWVEYGTVLSMDTDAIWLGTGMIQKLGDTKYIMNYSQEKPEGEQKIYFAESADLIHWSKIEGVVLEPDGKIYLKDKDSIPDAYPRWDSLGVMNALDPKQAPPYYAFLTSDTSNYQIEGKRGVLGCCTSNDGIHWTPIKPATEKTDIVPAFEVPEHFEMNGHHYVVFCTSSKLGFQFDPYAKYLSGGTYYVHSENLLGPYDFPNADPMLVGSRDLDNVTMGSVGRIIHENGKIIFYHIWGDQIADAWIGPVKEVVEKSEGQIQLVYSTINDAIKDMSEILTHNHMNYYHTKKLGNIYPVLWIHENNHLEFKNLGSSGIFMSEPYVFCNQNNSLLSDGRVIEFEIALQKGLGAGIVLQTASNQNVCLFLNQRDSSIDFTRITDGFCGNVVQQGITSKKVEFDWNTPKVVRVLVRRYFVEVYIDDVYINGLRLTEQFRNDLVGWYSEDCSGAISNFKIYQMN